MVLFSLEARTRVLIGLKDGSEIKSEFMDNYDDKTFYIYCPEISENMGRFANEEVNVTIFYQTGFYKARCRISGLGRRRGRYETVMLEAADGFRYEAQRTSPRIDIVMPAEIYNYTENRNDPDRGDLICRALSKDLSRDGIFLISEHNIDAPKGTVYTVSFYLSSYTFFIPAKLMWNKRSGTSYEYGFLFDFFNLAELQDKLNTAIFKEKIRYS